MATYALVDFANLCHRCLHVGSMTSSIADRSGMAMHIAFNSLKQIWNKFGANHVVVCLEGGSWRRFHYPEYKANRKVLALLKTPRERADEQFYFDAMNQFAEFLETKTNVTVLKAANCEADDFVARWIQLHPEDDHVIFSGDSDFYQLLGPRVRMYDGVKSWTISTTQVLNENDKPATRKRTVKSLNAKGKQITQVVEDPIEPPIPEYELFKKIIRGDASDNIMGAYPGVRENGSMKKPGILEAFKDRKAKGLEWNMFMQVEWNKMIGEDAEGNPTFKKVRVLDQYKENSVLIDLTAQPQEIKDLLDQTIVEACQKPPVGNVGFSFLKFCGEMNLQNIAKNPNDYANILQAGYK